MDAEWFSGRLRELREQAGLTREGLAEKAGVSVQGLIKWEQGTREPGWASVLALAKALGVSTEAFQTPPQPREPSGPGRPAAKKPDAAEATPKRGRGRPRKEGGGHGS
jgi:transcriptional regulator with XRE-family HTH domain